MPKTQTLPFKPNVVGGSIPAALIQSHNIGPELDAQFTLTDTHNQATTITKKGGLSALGLWGLLFFGGTITNPVVVIEPNLSPNASGSASIFWSARRRRGRVISLRDAYQLALRISNDTERRLQTERSAEAMFVFGCWEDES